MSRLVGICTVLSAFTVAFCQAKAADAPKEGETMVDAVKKTLGNLVDNGSPDIRRRLLEADLSTSCSLGLLKLMKGIRNFEPWAVRLIDATGKYPTGLLQGTQSDLGAFDECLETVALDEYGNEKIRGQYCSVYVFPPNDTSLVEALVPAMAMSHPKAHRYLSFSSDQRIAGVNVGVCITDDCGKQDVQKIANALSGGSVKINVENCVTSLPRPFSKVEIAIIACFGVIAVVIVCSTLYDLLRKRKAEDKEPTGLEASLSAFSLRTSLKAFLSVGSDKSSDSHRYRFVHGLRFLSAMWIVIGHGSVTFGNNAGRRMNVLHYHEKIENCAVTAAFLSVDTFFFLSGFLMVYVVHRQKANRLMVVLIALARRHIRTTVPVFTVIGFFYLLPLITSGPGMAEMMDKFYDELDRNWWGLLLQVRNFGKGLENGSFTHLWYISTDFQLFLAGICIVQIFRRKHWTAITVMSVLSLACCAFSAWQMHDSDYYPFPVILGKTFSATIDTLNDVYVLPTYHAVCFFAGCITFYMLVKYGDSFISRRATAVLWCVATACCLACVFNKYDWNRGEAPEGEWAKMAYAFGDKIIFSVALSWGVFACATGRGGIVNALLSWKAFVPLGRLSLGVYIIHVPFLNVHYGASRERLYYSAFALATQFFGVFMWSLVLSFFLFLLIEAPTGRLEKMFFSYIGRSPAKKSEKPTVVISYLKDATPGDAKKYTEEDGKVAQKGWSHL